MAISSWVDGAEGTITVNWTAVEIEIEVNTDKTLSSIVIEALDENSEGDGCCYFDDFLIEPGIDVEEDDITYVTRDDHTDVLPASIQHSLLTAPYLHAPGTHTHVIDNITLVVTQTAHGFVVGDVLKRSAGSYVKAKADDIANSHAVGIVSAVGGVNSFSLLVYGAISTLTSLVDGAIYYLSAATDGLYTATAPTTPGQVVKILMIANSTTSAFFINEPGAIVP